MAATEVLHVFNEGPERWNAWRKQARMRSLDLSRQDFSRRYICGYDLAHTILCGSILLKQQVRAGIRTALEGHSKA
jgi:hypothetical protein